MKAPEECIIRASQQLSHAAACLVESRRQTELLLNIGSEAKTACVAGFATDGKHLRLSVYFVDQDNVDKMRDSECVVHEGFLHSEYPEFLRNRKLLRNLQELCQENARSLRQVLLQEPEMI